MKQRIALGVEYNGANFFGWQRQPNAVSVQAALEQALSRLAKAPIQVVCAGRTDTGVHAHEQVVHFDTSAVRPIHAWVRGSNTFLPQTVRILWATEVNDDFHARYSATQRSYRYVLYCHSLKPALYAGLVGWSHRSLDIAKMRQAAAYLVGQQDFSSFRAAGCQAKSAIRNVFKIKLQVHSQHILTVDFWADAFLYRMVRNMMGGLLKVGRGEQVPQWIESVLVARSRDHGPATFMPDGLYFRRVFYPERFQLPHIPERAGWFF